MADKTIRDVVGKLLELHSLDEALTTIAVELDVRAGMDGSTVGNDAVAIRVLCSALTKDAKRPLGPQVSTVVEPVEVREVATGSVMPMLPDPWRFLAESGLLFEINRTLLHPVGMAIVLSGPSPEEDQAGPVTFAGIWDAPADPEGILFDEESLADGARKLRRWLASTGHGLLLARHKALGYVVQKSDVPDYFWWAGGPDWMGFLRAPDATKLDGISEAPKAAVRAKPWRIGYYTGAATESDVAQLREALFRGPDVETMLPETVRIVTHDGLARTGEPASGSIFSAEHRDDLAALNKVLAEDYGLPAGGSVLQKATRLLWERRSVAPGNAPTDGPQNPSPYAQKLLAVTDTLHGDLAKLRETLDTVGWPPAGALDLITEQASAALLDFHGKLQAVTAKVAPLDVPGTDLVVPKGWTLTDTPTGEVGRIHFQGATPPPLSESWKRPVLAVRALNLWTAEPEIRVVGTRSGDALLEAAKGSQGFEDVDRAVNGQTYHPFAEEGPCPVREVSAAQLLPCAATVNGFKITCLDPVHGDGFLRFVIAGRPKHPDQAEVSTLLFGAEPIRIAVEGLPFPWKVYVPSFPNGAYATWQRKRFAEGQAVSITFACAMDPAPLDVEPATKDHAVVGIATKTVQKGDLLTVDFAGQPPNPHTGEFAGLPFAYKTMVVKGRLNPCGGNNPLYRIEVELNDEAMEDGHEAFTKRLRAYSGTQAHPLSLATIGGPLNVRAVEWPGVSRSHRRVTFLEMPEQPITAAYMRAALAKLGPPGEFDGEERVLLAGQKVPAENGVYKVTRVETTPVYLGRPRPYITLADLEPRVERGVVLSALRESRWVDLDAPAGKAKLDTLFLDASAEFDALAAPHAARQYPPDLVKRVTCDLALGILYRRHGDAGVVPPPRPLSDLQALLHPSGTGSSRSQAITSPATKTADATLLAELHSLHQSGESLADTFHRLLDQARIEGAQRVTQRIDKGLADLLHGDE